MLFFHEAHFRVLINIRLAIFFNAPSQPRWVQTQIKGFRSEKSYSCNSRTKSAKTFFFSPPSRLLRTKSNQQNSCTVVVVQVETRILVVVSIISEHLMGSRFHLDDCGTGLVVGIRTSDYACNFNTRAPRTQQPISQVEMMHQHIRQREQKTGRT